MSPLGHKAFCVFRARYVYNRKVGGYAPRQSLNRVAPVLSECGD